MFLLKSNINSTKRFAIVKRAIYKRIKNIYNILKNVFIIIIIIRKKKRKIKKKVNVLRRDAKENAFNMRLKYEINDYYNL